MTTTKPCCPNCRSTELRIVGCFLLGPEGVPLDGSVTPELLLSSDFAVTRELVRCTDCSHRDTLEDARIAANLPTHNVLWENTDHGIRKPIVCSICGNQEHFVREVVRVRRETEYVTVLDGEATVTDTGGAPIAGAEVRLQYTCALEECDGVVVLRQGDYVLTKDI